MMFNLILLSFLFFCAPLPSHQECGQSVVDSIPVIAQLKSLWQVMTGDEDCARATQENFVRTAPVISQMTSIVQSAMGDDDAAKKTQEMYLDNMEKTVDSIPVLGHVDGLVHLAAGDKEGGEQIMKDATRTVAVVAGGLAGGPAGAVGAGLGYDSVVTAIDSAVNGKDKPYGLIDSIPKVMTGQASSGDIFDTGVGLASDATAGLGKGPISKDLPVKEAVRAKEVPSEQIVKRNPCKRSTEGCCGSAGGSDNNNNQVQTGEGAKVPNKIHYEIFDGSKVKPSEKPKEKRIQNPEGKHYATRWVQQNAEAGNRVEFLRAHITRDNLRKGSVPSPEARAYAKKMGNKDDRYAPDEAGHIIGNQLGGPGNELNNIFPQTMMFNHGSWLGAEQMVADIVKTNDEAYFSVRLIYDDSKGVFATRPDELWFKIEDRNGNLIFADAETNMRVKKGLNGKNIELNKQKSPSS